LLIWKQNSLLQYIMVISKVYETSLPWRD